MSTQPTNVSFAQRFLDRLPHLLALVCLGVAFVHVFQIAALNRSLWLDEALLAPNLVLKTLAQIWQPPLVNEQSAPLGYLTAVKLITLILGSSEFALRLYSLLAYFLLLTLVYLLLKNAFSSRYPLLAVAYIANLPLLLRYANEFKPYLGDCTWILAVNYFYYLYRQHRLSTPVLACLFCLAFFCSTPTLFFIIAIAVGDYLHHYRHAHRQQGLKICVLAAVFVIFAGFYYSFWLASGNSDNMYQFWLNYHYPLFPASLNDLYRQYALWRFEIFAQLPGSLFLQFALVLLGLTLSGSKKIPFALTTLLALSFLLFTSWTGNYPFAIRLVLFLLPLFGIFLFICLEWLTDPFSSPRAHFLFTLLASYFLITPLTTFQLDNFYLSREEVNPLLAYVDTHLQPDEYLYIFSSAQFSFLYKNNYNDHHFGQNIPDSISNVIIGQDWFSDGKNQADINLLQSLSNTYILTAHDAQRERITPLFAALINTGYLEEIISTHDTSLYFYTTDSARLKTGQPLTHVD